MILITVAAADRKEEKTALFLSQEPAASCFGSYDSLVLGQGASDCHNAAMHNLLLAVLQSKKFGFGKLLFLSRHLRISPNSPPTPPALTPPPPGLSTLLSPPLASSAQSSLRVFLHSSLGPSRSSVWHVNLRRQVPQGPGVMRVAWSRSSD